MPSTLKIDKIESRTPNAGLTIDWVGGGLKGPDNIPILTEDGKIVGDLLLLAQAANTPNTTTLALDFIKEATPGNGIQFLDQVYGITSTSISTINLSSTNSEFSTITTDTLTANTISVTGDLLVAGNTITLDTQTLLVEDNIVVFGSNNISDITDLGFATKYNDGANDLYAGLVRDATDGKFYLFKDYNIKPPVSTLVGLTIPSMLATLYGDFEANNIVIENGTANNLIVTTLTSTHSILENADVEILDANNATVNTFVSIDNTLENISSNNVTANNITTVVFNSTNSILENTTANNIGIYSLIAQNSILIDASIANGEVINLESQTGYIETLNANNVTISTLDTTNASVGNIQANNINATSYTNVDYNNLINKPDASFQAIEDAAFINSIIFG